ncbi:calcium-translocating P-type ATPase [Aaosphaeria arxii CBS 175.79]|uniref:Calcium-transporting ATPase n=1 Tax=Aaosphaeria arxii CBS 175.79 TaxID=1450172 RepID=A0A6A5XBD9_9PLEO|nr:calcium-translocating P-type ATPase [Aaosphaeria arxii CBS 175.79]KAF2010223.1 calcium-translocating P-type ATPase [Aaosphaeria arxii CBS 175.79]
MAASSSNDTSGREDSSPLPPLPEIQIDIPRTPARSNTNDTLSTLTEGASPSTLVPERTLRSSNAHSRSPSALSSASGKTPFARSRAPSEATLAPPGTSAAASTHSAVSSYTLESQRHDDALKADPGTEEDFVVPNNKFAFSPGQLNKMLNPKSLAAFIALGGLHGLETGLRTDVDAGLSIEETELAGTVSFEEVTNQYKKLHRTGGSGLPRPVEVRHVDVTDADPATGTHSKEAFYDRKRVYSTNTLPAKKPVSFLKIMWQAYYRENVLILLSAAAVISLALGLYETFGVDHGPGAPPSVDWIEGCAICVSIVVVVLVGAVNDYNKERAFVKLNAKKEARDVKVVRSGKSFTISVYDILVGDILHIEPGDLIPADGIFISGHNVKCDESSATGESDQMKKTNGEQVLRLLERGHNDPKDLDPFIISGSKVLEGIGTYMITSVGVNSSYGKILMAMRQEVEPTPLQVKLDGLAKAIAKLASAASFMLLLILLFRLAAQWSNGSTLNSTEKASQFMDILIVSVTIIVVAVPEGLPLAITLSLAFATGQMVKMNNLVRVLKSCETMGNATTVCSDKTGTLTQNKMTVVTGTFGDESFDDKNPGAADNRSTEFAQRLSNERTRLIIESIAINSTAFEGDGGEFGFVGSKTETALLGFAKTVLGMGSLSQERTSQTVVQMLPFDSGRKCMGAVMKLPNGSYRLLIKGASEILLAYSSKILLATGETHMDTANTGRIADVIDSYAKQSLRTIGIIYKDFAQWPPQGAESAEDPSVAADLGALLGGMTFVGVVGIQDPIRPGVPEAVAKCSHAGVIVRMVTGDNSITAKAIATDCGIYTDGIVMEGPEFRKLSEPDMDAILPRLQVLARSSPEDKRILVTRLRKLGGIVAVTGDGTNDGPALKAADIGFSMGIAGTEVAKEASSIILMDDNFASILTALMWGRSVNDAVQKFLQFQITVNITAMVVAFITAIQDPEMRSVLTAVQLLWINLFMDSLAALSLSTDFPTNEILDRPPTPRSASIISITMWKMIIGQAIYQVVATFVLHFAGPQFLPYPEKEMRSMIFNMFVWLQIFNQYNNRRLDNKLNIFVNIHKNYYFIGLNIIMVGCQTAIAYVGGAAFSIVRINGNQWAISVVIAIMCIPWGCAVRCFPDRWFEVIAKTLGRPFVMIYRPASRLNDRIISKIMPKKKGGDIAVTTDAASSDSGSFIGNGKTPMPRVSGDVEKGGL